MPSQREIVFRETMRALIQDDACMVPPALRCDLREHLYRRDADGHTLCFDSPQREQLLRLLFHWAECHNPALAARCTALGIVPSATDLEGAPALRPTATDAPRETGTHGGTVQSPTSRPARERNARTSGQGNLFASAEGESQ